MILPTLPSSFRWQSTPAGPALVCRALEPLAHHVFTTSGWKLGTPDLGRPEDERWAEVATALDVEQVARLRQVHGNTAVIAGIATDRPEADIIATADGEMAIAVQAADCVPLLIADRRTGAVAAAHAGWRGMVARAPLAAVALLERGFGARPADLVAAMGPSIAPCCYEVGADVHTAFVLAGFDRDRLARWFHAAPVPTPENPSMPMRRHEDRGFFDGWRCVRDQLVSAGVSQDQIFGAHLCTASHPALFCSYRRQGAAAGRIAGAIRAAPRRP